MGESERDPHTGYMTTGHEWNGIKELNTPVPKVVWFFLIAGAMFALTYTIFLPAWPFGDDYTKGVLQIDQRREVEAELRSAAESRGDWEQRLMAGETQDIRADAELMTFVRNAGRALYGDNCAMCHGLAGDGGNGYPNLKDGAWMWGGNEDAIAETIRVGINSPHDDSRSSQMLAFGRDQILERGQILDVSAFVRSLSDPTIASGASSKRVASGKEIFAEHCVDCHGAAGKGNVEAGAPDLTDDFWMYGGDEESVFRTISKGRQGQMPHWEGRLTERDRKILLLYILEIGDARE